MEATGKMNEMSLGEVVAELSRSVRPFAITRKGFVRVSVDGAGQLRGALSGMASISF